MSKPLDIPSVEEEEWNMGEILDKVFAYGMANNAHPYADHLQFSDIGAVAKKSISEESAVGSQHADGTATTGVGKSDNAGEVRKRGAHAGLVGDRTERSSRPAYGRLCGETEGHNHISPANAESKDHQRMGTLEEAGGNTPSVDSFTGRKTSTPPSAATPPTVGASTTLPLPQSTGEDKGEKGCTPRLVEVRGTDESGGMGDPPRYATSTAVEQPSRTAQEIAARREHQRLQQAEWERAADEKIQNQRILINAQFHQHQHAPEAAHHIRMQQNGGDDCAVS